MMNRHWISPGLNRTAFDLAVYASQGWSPTHHARLASGCWSGSTGRDWLPAGFHLKGFKLRLSSFPELLGARSDLLIIYLPISKGHFKGTQRGRLFTRRMTRRFRKRGRVGKKGLRRLTTARPRLARAAHQRRQAEGDLPLPRGGVVSDRT